ncbi:MAG: hypothetical protein ACUVWP_06635 [bacterium]
MKSQKIVVFILVISGIAGALSAGETQFSSTVWFRYFATYLPGYDSIGGDFTTSNFYIGRGYLTLSHAFTDRFSAKFRVNVYTDEIYPSGARVELRLAMVSMNLTDNFKINAGVIPHEFSLGNIWVYRTIPNIMSGERSFVASADFGFNIAFKPFSNFYITTQVLNGEGFDGYNENMNNYPSLSLDLRYNTGKLITGVSALFEKNGGIGGLFEEEKNRFVATPFFRMDMGKMDLYSEFVFGKYAKNWKAEKTLGFMVAGIMPLTPFFEPVARFDYFDPNMDEKNDNLMKILGGVNLYLWRGDEKLFSPNILLQPQWRMTDYMASGAKSVQEILIQLQFNLETKPF